MNSLDPANLLKLGWGLWDDFPGTIYALVRSPLDMFNGLLQALRDCDYETAGEITTDGIGLLAGAAAGGVGLVNRGVIGGGRGLGSRSIKWWDDAKITIHPSDDPSLPPSQFNAVPKTQPSKYTCASTCISMADESFGLPSNVDDLNIFAETVNATKGTGIIIEEIEQILRRRGYTTGSADLFTRLALPDMQSKLQQGYAIIADAGSHPGGHAVLMRSVTPNMTDWSVTFFDPWTGQIALADRMGWSTVTGGSSRYIYFKP